MQILIDQPWPYESLRQYNCVVLHFNADVFILCARHVFTVIRHNLAFPPLDTQCHNKK